MMGKGRERRLLSARDAAHRYEQALREGRSPLRYDRDIPGQVAAFRFARERELRRASEVRRWLGTQGVPLIQYVVYLNFARHVAKVCRRYGLKTRAMLVAMAVDRWVAYGLERRLLESLYEHLAPILFEGGPEDCAEVPCGK
jgi:hypothetical protein